MEIISGRALKEFFQTIYVIAIVHKLHKDEKEEEKKNFNHRQNLSETKYIHILRTFIHNSISLEWK